VGDEDHRVTIPAEVGEDLNSPSISCGARLRVGSSSDEDLGIGQEKFQDFTFCRSPTDSCRTVARGSTQGRTGGKFPRFVAR